MFRSKSLFQILLLTSIGLSSCIAAEGEWSSLGAGFDGPVKVVQSYDNKLIVGGDFTTVGDGTAARGIAAWDGASWSALGTGLTGNYSPIQVNAMTIYDGKLVVAGAFDSAGGLPADKLAYWDGTGWYPFEEGQSLRIPYGITIFDDGLTVADDSLVWILNDHEWSTLPALWVNPEICGGTCVTEAYGSIVGYGDTLFAQHWVLGTVVGSYSYIEFWDGSSWSTAPRDAENMKPLFPFAGSAGEPLAVLAKDTVCGWGHCAYKIEKVAKWTGTAWSEVFNMRDVFKVGTISAIAPYENGFAFGVVAGQLNSGLDDSVHVYVWDGRNITPLGAGVGGELSTNAYYEEVSTIGVWQERLVAGGYSYLGGDQYSYYLALWTEEDKFEVALDIKPGSCRNPINAISRASQSNAVVPVAVMGTEEFDVNEIDPSTITLAGVVPIRHAIEDVGAPADRSEDSCACTENGPDGYDDLTLKFRRSELIDALSGFPRSAETRVYLTGALYDSTAIEGYDCVELLHRQEGPELTSSTLDLPGKFTVYGAFPNPFNPSTTISYDLPEQCHVRVEVYNMLGQRVTLLVDETRPAGTHSVQWNADDFASGIYLYRLQAGEQVVTRKMLLLK